MNYIVTAQSMARFSLCKRRKIGAVVIHKEGMISGYNRIQNSDYSICGNCPREGQEHGVWVGNQDCPALHAEESIILYAAKYGECLDGATLYITDKPCNRCARLIVGAGFKKVIYLSATGSNDGINYLTECGVEVEQYKQDAIIIDNPGEGMPE